MSESLWERQTQIQPEESNRAAEFLAMIWSVLRMLTIKDLFWTLLCYACQHLALPFPRPPLQTSTHHSNTKLRISYSIDRALLQDGPDALIMPH